MSNAIVFKYSPTLAKRLLKCNDNWSSSDSSYIKRKLRYHLREQFQEKCFYCGVELQTGNAKAEIDHIVPKGDYRSFTFRPENLVWSCRECNTTKGTNDTLIEGLRGVTYSYNDYPLNSHDYEIVHAYFDNYEDHIELEDNLFITAKAGSSKGVQTILMCGLYRLQLTQDKVKAIMKEKEIERKAYTKVTGIFENKSNEEYESEIRKIIDGVDEELENFKLINEVLSTPEIFDIGYSIIKFKNVHLFNERNKKLFAYFSKKGYMLNYYINLYNYINEKVNIKREIENYLVSFKEKKTLSNILKSHDEFMYFKQECDSGNINIDNRVKRFFIKKRDCLILTKTDFVILNYLIKNIKIIEYICKEMLNIASNKDFIPLLLDLTPQSIQKTIDISKINNDNLHLKGISHIPVLHDWFNHMSYDSKNLKSTLKICEDLKQIEGIL
ncbi:HNH endonuclease [Lysinibacillus sp. JK80]|uniref:HNH endonuclease n=1 Tax=Lysinibacillus sp. JK80 TaxID=2749809 RepID=UPI0022B96651|nr:HNH endonuclease [Lysinibacillus sp. JK80]WBF57657.1 HNH endonuclease [Lysinibacillus sp. JK80]